MKAIKGLGLFAGLGILISSCFDPPEFSNQPVIKLEDIYLGIPSDPNKFDSLVLKLSFKDGDGDLGLESAPLNNPDHFFYPFNLNNFYLTKDGEMVKIASGPTNFDARRMYQIIDDLGETGKLVTKRTIEKGSYPDIPDYTPGSCEYLKDTVWVEMADADLIDHSTMEVVDTATYSFYIDGKPQPITFMVVTDTFYIEKNPNYKNIIIEFWKQPTTGGALELVQFGAPCAPAFDTRFPVLSHKDEGTPLEGVLTYSLKTNAIRDELMFNFFMLKIRIQDRTLNPSNQIETKMYSIDALQR
jgi:hypothetical protein